jgi:cellulose synthase/poly-beta-1,6-N-acetylglucosamine synthase-like glycosyltransferase
MAAYNESTNIINSVDGLLHLSYRYKQIIVVNDGSTDKTLELLKEKYQLIQIPQYFDSVISTKPIKGVYRSRIHQAILVIDKENGQKYDAINAGLGACKNAYFMTVDADTSIDDGDFEMLIRPILSDPKTIAIGASVRILNGCFLEYNRINSRKFPNTYLTAMQALEYLRAFIQRQGWSEFNCNYLISGAFAVFLTKPVLEVGGFAPTVADDLEIVMRLNRYMRAKKIPYNMIYLPDPVAWTEVPDDYKQLARQRLNWHRGMLECLWFHKSLLFNPRYGRFGLIAYPYLLYAEAMEPVVELIGIVYIVLGLLLNALNVVSLVFVLAVVFFFVFCFTVICILIEELTFNKFSDKKSIALLIYYSLLENLGYRQLSLIWRLRGMWDFFVKFSKIQMISKKINRSLYEKLKKETSHEKDS